jgi:hypothetical protein
MGSAHPKAIANQGRPFRERGKNMNNSVKNQLQDLYQTTDYPSNPQRSCIQRLYRGNV